jgi:AcrR family transcriptional regulator
MTATADGRSATRREELLAATRRVVGRTGFAKATVEQITREAGASLGLLHYHFASKDDVVAEAFAQAAHEDLAELEAIARAGGTAPERLAACLGASDWDDEAAWRLWVDAWGEAVHGQPMRATLASFQRSWRAVIAQVIADGVAEGAWSCADPADAAARLVAGIDGIGLHATLHPGDVDGARASAWARRQAELELGVALPGEGVETRRETRAAAPVALVLSLRRADFGSTGRAVGAVYSSLLDEGRAAWLAGRLDGLEVSLSHLEIDLHRPLTRPDGPVTVSCALARLGHAGLTLREQIATRDGEVAVRAETTLAAPRPLTAPEREALAA